MNRTSRAALIGLGLLSSGLGAAFSAPQAHAQQAEVTLLLVNPTNPGLLFVNDTAAEAKDLDYKIALWNADNMEDGKKLLPVPGSGFSLLQPNTALGPINLFETPEVRTWLKPGNRIVGNIGVNCQNCTRGHTYWVLITWGEGGWFAELKDKTNGSVIAPQPWIDGNLRNHELKVTLLAWTTDIAQPDRIAITPFTPSEQPPTPNADTTAR